jgi:hypothetical protein
VERADVRQVDVGLERVHLAPERVAPRQRVHQAQVLAVEHDQARARPEHRRAAPDELPQRLGQPFALDAQRHRRGLAAGHDEPVDAVEVRRRAHLAGLDTELVQHPGMRIEPALKG